MIYTTNEIVEQIDKLPTLNTVAFEVVNLCADKEIPIPRLVKLISGDQSLTSQILKLANSSYFNYPRTIYSLDRAIIILGFRLLRDIAVSLAIFSIYKGFKANRFFDLAAFWRHALFTGFALKAIAESYDPENKELLYISGLLHDLGKPVLVKQLGDDYRLLVEKSSQEQASLAELESRFLNFDHAELGAALLEKWNLPESIVLTTRYHHNPDAYPGEDTNAMWIRLVYLGNLLAKMVEKGKKTFQDLIELDPHFEKYYSLSDVEVEQLVEGVEQEIKDQQKYIQLFETAKK